MNETKFESKLSTIINSYLSQNHISKSTFLTFDLLERMTYYITVKSFTIYNAFLSSIEREEIDFNYSLLPLSDELAYLLQKYTFSEYSDPSIDIEEICKLEMFEAKPEVLSFLGILPQHNFLKVIELLELFLSERNIKELATFSYNYDKISDKHLVILQRISARYIDILFLRHGKYQYKESYLDWFNSLAHELQKRQISCTEFLFPYQAIIKNIAYDVILRMREQKERLFCNLTKKEEENFYKVLNKLQRVSRSRFYDYQGFLINSGIRFKEDLLTYEPLRHIASAQNFVLLNRENEMTEYYEFILANVGSFNNVEIFARQDFRVKFIGERGADGGGLKRESLYMGITELYKPKYQLFHEYENGIIWINNFYPLEEEIIHENFRFFGIFLGICLLNHIEIDSKFPMALFKLLLNRKSYTEQFRFMEFCDELLVLEYTDIKELDEDLYLNTLGLLKLREQGIDIAELEIYYIAEEDVFGSRVQKELIPNGLHTKVTNFNVEDYIYKRFYFELLSESYALEQCRIGFEEVIPQEKLEYILPFELERIIGGDEVINFEHLEKITKYEQPYSESHPSIIIFWEVLNEFSQEEKELFVEFMFCSKRVPIEGFEEFSIMEQGDKYCLPCAHTCSETLALPPYESRETMREKLVFSIENFSGFGVI